MNSLYCPYISHRKAAMLCTYNCDTLQIAMYGHVCIATVGSTDLDICLATM